MKTNVKTSSKKRKREGELVPQLTKVLLNVGLSPVHPVFENDNARSQNAKEHSIQVFGKLAQHMVVDGINVSFVPAWSHDVDANEQAAQLARTGVQSRKIQSKGRMVIGTIQTTSHVPTLLDLLEAMKQVDVVIAMRLHIAVFAHSMEIPFVAVAYRLKAFDWAASVNMVNHVVAIDRMHHLLLYDMAKTVTSDPTVHVQMAAHNQGAVVLWKQFRDELQAYLLNDDDGDVGGRVCAGLCDGFVVLGDCDTGTNTGINTNNNNTVGKNENILLEIV